MDANRPRELHVGRVIDGTGREMSSAIIELADSKIEAIRELPDDHASEFEALTALPGLIDLHVHLYGQAEPDKFSGSTDRRASGEETDAYLACVSAANARRTIEAGFTTIRDMGGPNDINIDIARAIERRVIPGPRVLATSTIDMSHEPGYRETHGSPGSGYTGATETRRAAREKVSSGADVIHVKATGAGFGFFEPTTLLLNVDELEAAISEAHRLGVRTTAHACGSEGIRNAVLAGTQCIEHGQYLYEVGEITPQMLEGQVGWVPTLMNNIAKLRVMEAAELERRSSGLPSDVERRVPALVAAHRRSFEMAMEAGVLVGLGTDVGAPFTPNGTNARELECFVEYGATEMQAIEAATRVAATILRMDHEIGTLEPGKRADLIVVRGNPLEDIRVLQDLDNILLVIKGGEIIVDRRQHAAVEVAA